MNRNQHTYVRRLVCFTFGLLQRTQKLPSRINLFKTLNNMHWLYSLGNTLVIACLIRIHMSIGARTVRSSRACVNTDQITLRVIDENLHISGSFGGLGGLDSFSSLIHDDKTERDEVSDATSQNKSNGERALYFALSWICRHGRRSWSTRSSTCVP